MRTIPDKCLQIKFLSLVLLTALLAGCAHRAGERFEPAHAPVGAPAVETILQDLAQNESRIQHFVAKGRFILKTPQLDAVYSLPSSSIAFQRPANLYVEGRKYTALVLRLICSEEAFLIDLPTEKQYFQRERGQRIEGVPFQVTPVEVARELFLPEGWDTLSPKRVRIEAFDAAAQTAELTVLSKSGRKAPQRRLWVRGTPWVVTRSQLLDSKSGEVVAETAKEDYRIEGGVRFPASVEVNFPNQKAMMRFDLRSYDLNKVPDAADFDWKARIQQLRKEGYEEIEYAPEAPK